MPQRRLSPDPRVKRKRVPAYQLHRSQRPTAEGRAFVPDRRDSDDLHPASIQPEPTDTVSDLSETLRPGEPGTETVGAAEAVIDSQAVTEAHEAADEPLGTQETLAPDQTSSPDLSDGTEGQLEAGGENSIDYAAYAESVESAAVRGREEPELTADDTTAFPIVPPPQRPAARLRPITRPRVQGSRGGRGNGNGKRPTDAAEPDPRPLLKRPKTWMVVFLMVAAVAAIGGVLWSLNLLRVTYQAYNAAHVDATERPVYRVNEQGNPEVVPTEEVVASLPNWDQKDPFNILLMGVDTRPSDIYPPRSDTIIVVHVDPVSKQVSMMSIPRDLHVQIPSRGWDKINAAYTYGEEREENGGPALVAQTIEANFDIRIHYFVTVDFIGFREIIDTIGGVVIDVPEPVKDDMYPTEELGYTRQYFPAGLQKMDGETALRYSRTRHNDNDIQRGERQQQMLMAIRQQSMDLGLITRADDLLRQVGDTVRYDLNANQLLALAKLGSEIDAEDIQRVNLWEAGVLYEDYVYDETVDQNVYYMEADWVAVQGLMEQYFASERTAEVAATPTLETTTPTVTTAPATATATATVASIAATPESTTIEPTPTSTPTPQPETANLSIPVIVENDSTVDLVATNISNSLYQAGFETVIPETGTEVFATTTIYDYAGSPATARFIAEHLGLPESSIVYSSGGTGIIVAVGEDLATLYGGG